MVHVLGESPSRSQVQVLQARPSKSQRFAEAIGQGLNTAMQMYGQHQRGKEAEQEYQQQNQNYKQLTGGRDLSKNPEIRKMEIEYALRGRNDQLSRGGETPLQAAQRKKILFDVEQAEGENDYYNKLMRGNGAQDTEMNTEEQYEMPSRQRDFNTEPEEAIQSRESKPKLNVPKFKANDPSTWSKKQIDSFRSYQGTNPKGKTLARQAQNEFEARQEKTKKSTAYKETVAPYQSALKTIDEMRNIGARGNLGVGTSWSPFPKTRKDASEYERLGKSLIALASTITIRNQREFDVLAHDLYDPTLTDASRAGILDAMEKIIRSSMEGVVNPDEEGSERSQLAGPAERRNVPPSGAAPKQKPPLQSFFR